MSETFKEQLGRLQLMASGDEKWDLSDNDCAAIAALLQEWKRADNIANNYDQAIRHVRAQVEQFTAASIRFLNEAPQGGDYAILLLSLKSQGLTAEQQEWVKKYSGARDALESLTRGDESGRKS